MYKVQLKDYLETVMWEPGRGSPLDSGESRNDGVLVRLRVCELIGV